MVPDLVSSAWATLRGKLLELGTRVTWKGGHQSEPFNPRQEKDESSCLEPHSLSLRPAESPNELSLHSFPTRLACSLHAGPWQGLLGPTSTASPSFSRAPSVLSLATPKPPFPRHLWIRMADHLHLEDLGKLTLNPLPRVTGASPCLPGSQLPYFPGLPEGGLGWAALPALSGRKGAQGLAIPVSQPRPACRGTRMPPAPE